MLVCSPRNIQEATESTFQGQSICGAQGNTIADGGKDEDLCVPIAVDGRDTGVGSRGFAT